MFKEDYELFELIHEELKRQQNTIELIASENITSKPVMEACGSILTNKYAEGRIPELYFDEQGNQYYRSRRFYNGCEIIDKIETLACNRFKELFNTDYHVNVQPHSGAQANMAVMEALLEEGDTILSMDLSNGGHLSHGSPVNYSGKHYNIVSYGIEDNGYIDMDKVCKLAKENNPKLIICGASNYSKIINFAGFAGIRDVLDILYGGKHYLMADIAHIAGLVAGGVHPSPFGIVDVVTTTTHKSLRGPRGGVIACKNELAKFIDKGVFPGVQGGPLEHIIAGKAVCFKEANTEEFKQYAKQIITNAKRMCKTFLEVGIDVVGGMTENHLMTIDLRKFDLSGKDVANVLEKAGITVNKNTVPNDPKSPFVTSGIRIGVPAITARGMGELEAEKIAFCIYDIITAMTLGINIEPTVNNVRRITQQLCDEFPIY